MLVKTLVKKRLVNQESVLYKSILYKTILKLFFDTLKQTVFFHTFYVLSTVRGACPKR